MSALDVPAQVEHIGHHVRVFDTRTAGRLCVGAMIVSATLFGCSSSGSGPDTALSESTTDTALDVCAPLRAIKAAWNTRPQRAVAPIDDLISNPAAADIADDLRNLRTEVDAKPGMEPAGGRAQARVDAFSKAMCEGLDVFGN